MEKASRMRSTLSSVAHAIFGVALTLTNTPSFAQHNAASATATTSGDTGGAAGGLNDQIKAANLYYQQSMQAAQDQLNGANTAMNNCNMQYQADESGNANPELQEVPDDKTGSILTSMLPALTQLGPALPGIMDSLKGADSKANIDKNSAISDYNGVAQMFDDRFATEAGYTRGQVKSILQVGLANKRKADTLPAPSGIRNKAAAICNTIEANAGSDIAKLNKVNSCRSEVNILVESYKEMQSKVSTAEKTNDASGALMGAAATAALSGFMASKEHDQQKKTVQHQNTVAQKAADNGLAACKADAQNQINTAKRNLANLESERADALRDLALRNAAMISSNKYTPSTGVDVNGTTALKPFNPGTPDGAVAKAPTPPAGENAGGGGSGGAAGGAPGGAGGGGSPSWGFGGNGAGGNFLGGGLPGQEPSASFVAEGGGGAFSGGFNSEGGELSLDTDTGLGGGEMARGLASEGGIGDGGLNVLMSRMRLRFAYHAGELMQGVDLQSLAQKSGKPARASGASEGSSTSEEDRSPASKF